MLVAGVVQEPPAGDALHDLDDGRDVTVLDGVLIVDAPLDRVGLQPVRPRGNELGRLVALAVDDVRHLPEPFRALL